MRRTFKILSLLILSVFMFNLLARPSMPASDSKPKQDQETAIPPGSATSIPADYPDNYTRVRWEQNSVSEEWEETYEDTHWEFGPLITWSVRNATNDELITVTDTIDVDGWTNFIVKIPKNSLGSNQPYAVAFLGSFVNISQMQGESEPSMEASAFVALHIIPDGRWMVYSSKNATFMGEDSGGGGTTKPPSEQGVVSPDLPPDWTLEDMFGPEVDPFMEMNLAGNGYYTGPENLWNQFQLKFNSSSPTGVFQFFATVVDSDMQPIAESMSDDLSARTVGMTLHEVLAEATGGYYSWTREDDDGNPVYSATRGVDFNMTFVIGGFDLANATIFIDLPNQVLDERVEDGPYVEKVTKVGGWQWDPAAGTYFYNSSIVVETYEQRYGLHTVEEPTYFDATVEYEYYEPGTGWVTGYSWARMALVYWFANNSFGSRLAYDYPVWVDDGMGGGWFEYEMRFEPLPSDGSIPISFILNETSSNWVYEDGHDVLTFRGHISEDMLPTGGEYWDALYLDEEVMTTDGKRLVPYAFLPFAEAGAEMEYNSLKQLAVETPISVVRLLHKGQPYDPSWLFAVDRTETFTVRSRLQGGAQYAADVDGVAFVMDSYEYEWGYDAFGDWSQESQVMIHVLTDPEGNFEVTVFNHTRRTSYQYGEHWDWQYVEVFPGYFEWQQVLVEDYFWNEQVWDFETNSWSDEWIPMFSNETIMPVNYVEVGNLTYEVIGNDLRILFDVTPTEEMPSLEWNWNYYYGNLSLVTDYESGWGEHTVVGWVQDNVYSYQNGTDRVYMETPYRGVSMRNNDTDEIYPTVSYPYIMLNGTKQFVKKVITDDPYGGATETTVFEEWDPDAYDPYTGEYSGNWVYYYRLLNDTKVPIESGHEVLVYNITLSDNVTWFLSPQDTLYHAWWLPGDMWYLIALNGTAIVRSWLDWENATGAFLGAARAFEVGMFSLANGTIPIFLATEPLWTGDHYVLYLNETWEEIHVWEEFHPELGQWFYAYHNVTDGAVYWFYDGVWPYGAFEYQWNSITYIAPDQVTRFYAYTTFAGTEEELPYPGAEVYDIYDLEMKTPSQTKVEINGDLHLVQYIGDYWTPDPSPGYWYPFYIADVEGVIYNLTLYGLYEYEPWNPDPAYPEDFPWVSTANRTIRIPNLLQHDWTVAYGQKNPETWEFEVDGWLDLVTGEYTGDLGTSKIFDHNDTYSYDYVLTADGHKMNYTWLERAYFYNITLSNGTIIYSGWPWVEAYEVYNAMEDYYELVYFYTFDLDGNMVTWSPMQEWTISVVIADDFVNPGPASFLFEGVWRDIVPIEVSVWDTSGQYWYNDIYEPALIDMYPALINATHTLEVMALMDDYEMRYNIPSFNFTLNGIDWFNATGKREMIYKAYTVWGYGKKWDYVPLPVSIVRDQWSIVIGTPDWGLWGVNSWKVNPTNGALDLDGNLDTTDDQYYVQQSFESVDSYNVTEEFLWVSILWEPNGTLVGDEFHVESFTGLHTVNWTFSWAENFIWTNAETGEVLTPQEFEAVNSTIFDENGNPRPGYWDISWMAKNFTSDDLKQQAIDEGWDWAMKDSQEWSWISWELAEHYGTELPNGSYASVDVWYEYAGMFAWNDTNSNNVMDFDPSDITDSEVTHYWMPYGVDDVSFVTPNASSSGDEFWDVNATVPFGVTFTNVSGTVFPFGSYSYFDWYQGQYYGSDLGRFDERPTDASVDEFKIGAAFTGTLSGSDLNTGSVKFNLTVGDWMVDAPGGRSVLTGRSLGLAFYTVVSLYSQDGEPLTATFQDDYGSPVYNNQTVSSQNYTMSTGLSQFGSMNMGGSYYSWSKNKSADYTIVDSQTVPIGAFQAAYSSQAGGTATSFSISEEQFYTLIDFRWWGGYEVSVDPVFVGYSSSRGVSDTQSPKVNSVDTRTRYVDDNERLYFEVSASDTGGAGVEEVIIVNQDDLNDNTSLTYSGDKEAWVGHIEMQGTDPYIFNGTIVVADYAGNT
ncbi:hypothetical protein EU546_03225, partial [Candidatus Thorarchaeota archaeon]